MASAFPEEDLDESCDNCGEDRVCYCLKCMLSLCKKCKDSHAHSEEGHDILDLPPLEQNMPMCVQHNDRESTLYCWGCQVPTCEECARENHLKEGHDVVEMTTAALIKRNQLIRDFAEEKNKLTPQLQSQVKNIEEGVEAYKAYFQNLKDAMTAQAEKLKQMVNEVVEERQRELKEMEKNSAIILQEQRQKLEDHVAEIHDTINEYRETEQSGDPEKIKEFADKNMDKISRLKQFPEMVKVTPPTYESAKVDVDFIREMFGTLVFKEHTWSTDERLKIPDPDELIQLPTIDKEDVRKKFGTLVVTEAEPTEEDTQENQRTEETDPPVEAPEGDREFSESVISDHEDIPGETDETKDIKKNASDSE